MRTGLHNIYPFPHYIYTLYQDEDFTGTKDSFRERAAYCAKHGIKGIAIDQHWWNPAFASIADEYGIQLYVHTVNDAAASTAAGQTFYIAKSSSFSREVSSFTGRGGTRLNGSYRKRRQQYSMATTPLRGQTTSLSLIILPLAQYAQRGSISFRNRFIAFPPSTQAYSARMTTFSSSAVADRWVAGWS